MMSGLSQPEREAVWEEIEGELRQFEGQQEYPGQAPHRLSLMA
jgi:hypothetical protein